MQDLDDASKMVTATKPEVPVKTEPGIAESVRGNSVGAPPTDGPSDTHQKTIQALAKNPKAVLRQVQDVIINLKKKYEQTSNNKYTEAINGDIGKLIPHFVKSFKGIERLCAEEAMEDKDATIYAIAVKLDSNYGAYNDLMEWVSKMSSNKKQKKE
eukprot:9477823-Pyramimonas_sp.AAC.2